MWRQWGRFPGNAIILFCLVFKLFGTPKITICALDLIVIPNTSEKCWAWPKRMCQVWVECFSKLMRLSYKNEMTPLSAAKLHFRIFPDKLRWKRRKWRKFFRTKSRTCTSRTEHIGTGQVIFLKQIIKAKKFSTVKQIFKALQTNILPLQKGRIKARGKK